VRVCICTCACVCVCVFHRYQQNVQAFHAATASDRGRYQLNASYKLGRRPHELAHEIITRPGLIDLYKKRFDQLGSPRLRLLIEHVAMTDQKVSLARPEGTHRPYCQCVPCCVVAALCVCVGVCVCVCRCVGVDVHDPSGGAYGLCMRVVCVCVCVCVRTLIQQPFARHAYAGLQEAD
jgi:hypothetical protein